MRVGCTAFSVNSSLAGAALQEQEGSLQVAICASKHKWRHAIVSASSIHISTTPKQLTHYLQVPLLACLHQRSPAISVCCIQISAAPKQLTHYLQMPLHAC